MADVKLVLVKQTSCPVRTALHTMWGPVVMDPVSYAVLQGKEGVVILGSPTLAALGNNVYDTLANTGLESPNFKECRRVSIAVEALQQRDPGAPEPPDEAVERLVSRGSDMSIEPGREEREHAVALAMQWRLQRRIVCRPRVRRGCARSWIGTGMRFGAAFVVIHLPVSSC